MTFAAAPLRRGAMGERADRQCTCKECNREFSFTAAEQEQHALRGHRHAPSRCPTCREARALRNPERAGGRSLHPVICARCGAPIRVPFVPRTERPVFCRPCFLEMRGE